MPPNICVPSQNPQFSVRSPSLSLTKPFLRHHYSLLFTRRRATSYILFFLALWVCLSAFQISFPSLLNRATHRHRHRHLLLRPPPPRASFQTAHQDAATANEFWKQPAAGLRLLPSLNSSEENYNKQQPAPVNCTTHRHLPPPPTASLESAHRDAATTDEFWKRPEAGLRLLPCLNFSEEYYKGGGGRASRRFLMAVVSGGLNQQRYQVIDAVIIARILEAVLVLPVFQVNQIWGDDSKFSDLFDEQHFKKTLREDVRVVSSLPASYRRKRPVRMASMPVQASEEWIRTHLLPKLKKESVAVISAFDSRLSKQLNPDLQKLRCKVAFEALRFRPWIEEMGQKLSEKMAEKGPYMALHLRLEKDKWARTGCLTGLGEEADRVIADERAAHPQVPTSRSKLTAHDRYLAGSCPLNADEISRLLKGLGVPKNTRIYWAGGEPFGGLKALAPLTSEYHALHNKWNLTIQGELNEIRNKPSVLAAIDYIVCLKSQLFMANNGGNMARALQGHRIYMGNGKHIRPNKKMLAPLFMNRSMSESEMGKRINRIHAQYSQPSLYTNRKPSLDVVAYPIPDCMCVSRAAHD